MVGTGMEAKVARDSKAVVVCRAWPVKCRGLMPSQIVITKNGSFPEGKRKIVHDPENGVFVYNLRKFMRSNAGTCVNQKPIVEGRGQSISKGQVIADGPCTDKRGTGPRTECAGRLHALEWLQL
jgi:DNA-directed RNA polymerase subunit beta